MHGTKEFAVQLERLERCFILKGCMQCLLLCAHKRRRLWITAKIRVTFKHLESSLLLLAPTTLSAYFSESAMNHGCGFALSLCFFCTFCPFAPFPLLSAYDYIFWRVCVFSNERRVRKIWHFHCTYIVYIWNIWVALLVRLLRCAETCRT